MGPVCEGVKPVVRAHGEAEWERLPVAGAAVVFFPLARPMGTPLSDMGLLWVALVLCLATLSGH